MHESFSNIFPNESIQFLFNFPYISLRVFLKMCIYLDYVTNDIETSWVFFKLVRQQYLQYDYAHNELISTYRKLSEFLI